MDILSIFFLGFLGPTEIILGVLVIVLLFGGKKIPELMKGLGKGMTEFKKAREEDKDAIDDADLAEEDTEKLEK